MCGIAGALDRTGRREFSVPRLLAMTRAIAHRGPDDEQFHDEPGVILGARRLSIVDLQGGRQPIANEDGSVWVAFNGELFEYPELRQELLGRGHTLSTRCDTEAWVHLYEDHGEEMFSKARGQFAVSLWDRKNRTLILGRDRVGICPLYYAERDGWLLWGSEIKALLASGMVPANPDVAGVDHLFSFFCAGTTRTYFEGIKSIPPGHYLKVKDGKLSTHCYWDLDFPDRGQERRMDDPAPLIDELEHLMRQSVERRLRGDVPVVSYISGGLDSTVVLGLSSRERGHAVPSFTIGFDNAGPDERAHSAESAKALGSPLTTVTLSSPEIAAMYPELVLAAEGPVMDTSCAALMKLAATVHDQGYKVALTGEGADEALAGYVWFKTQAMRERIAHKIGHGIPLMARRLLLAAVGGGSRHRAPLYGIGGVRTAQQDMYELIGQARPILYSSGMWDRLGDHNPYDDLSLPSAEKMKRWHPMNQSLYVGYKVMLAGLLMISKGDRISMHSSVETRYPFLDDDVINFCSQLAPEYKLRGKTEKWILRQVAARTLPSAIANRPKTMFRSRFSGTFLNHGHPAWVDQLLSADSLRKTGYFDPEMVKREQMKQQALPRITARRFVMDIALTNVVSTQLWHHLYFGGLCDLPSWTPPRIDLGASPSNGHV
ncbi:asparagine synthase (glutamine-hydrolyzing) [Tundrisphaera lichenicola]|uniref:asparagine synthase (glutamine-hydrolyzing) n=1 Tax=Tundrisphaera lichenicola TaxID=2029860 RepID=UPI003EB8BDB2